MRINILLSAINPGVWKSLFRKVVASARVRRHTLLGNLINDRNTNIILDMPNNTRSAEASGDFDNRRILVIDDNTQIHDDFRKILQSSKADPTLEALDAAVFGKKPASRTGVPEFDLDFATQGEEGYHKVCESLENGQRYSAAFVDVRMPPGWDGVEAVSKIMEVDSKIQIAFCTAYSDYAIEDIVDKFGLSDRVMILQKPFDPVELQMLAVSMTQKWCKEIVLSQVGRTQTDTLKRASAVLDETQRANELLLNEKQVYEADAQRLSNALKLTTSRIAAAEDAMLFAIATVVETRDVEMGDHLKRMQKIAQIIAEQLYKHGAYKSQIDEKFLHDFFRSTPLHDLGKVGIPDGILLKASALTESEYEIMKQHSVIGHEIICKTAKHSPFCDFMSMAADIARHHHEAWDGTGYPDGLAGTAIPLSARIAAVADAFDAMTSKRIYKSAVPDFEARCEIEKHSGKQFDPEVVTAFCAVFSEICEAKRRYERSASPPETTGQLVW